MGLSPPVPGRREERSAAVPTTLRFARAARALSSEARRLGLTVPGFRSPPGLPETDRTIRRADWGAVVSVRLRGRPFAAVLADMVDGVVAANRLDPDTAHQMRVRLLQAVAPHAHEPAATPAEAA